MRWSLPWLAAGLVVGASSGCRAPEPLPDDAPVVLVVIDTLRADHLGVYGSSRAISPDLDRWAEKGVRFDMALAPAPWTLPSIGSLLTGRYPPGHGAGMKRRVREGSGSGRTGLDPTLPTLAERLQEDGYATAAMVTNTWLRPEFGLDRGFDLYDYARNALVSERRVDVMVDRALEWIDGVRSTPFFLLLHVLDPHLPYDPHPSVRGRFTAGYDGELELPFVVRSKRMGRIRSGEITLDEEDRAFIADAYDEELVWVARHVARFVSGLEERGILDEGLVLLTADHGEELFDHGSFEHGHTMFQELLRVPFVAWGRGLAPRRLTAPVSLVDVMPTVLDALSLPVLEGLDGISLWPALTLGREAEGRSLVATTNLYGPAQQALVRWPYKLIVQPRRERALLYDLQEDPGERRDLSGAAPERAAELGRALEEALQQAWLRPASPTDVTLDREALDDLRALGYLD